MLCMTTTPNTQKLNTQNLTALSQSTNKIGLSHRGVTRLLSGTSEAVILKTLTLRLADQKNQKLDFVV